MMRHFPVVLALLLVFACAATKPARQAATPHGNTSTPPALANQSADGGTNAASETVNPALEAKIAALDALREADTFGEHRPLRHVAPIRIAARGRFPAKAIASAELFIFRYGGSTCEAEQYPFAKDGSMCGDVATKRYALSDTELEDLAKLFTDREREYDREQKEGGHTRFAVMHCGFDPHHTVVFYDKAGSAIAKVVVCLTCGESALSPSSEASGSGPHSWPDITAFFFKLARARELPTWMYVDAEREEVIEYKKRVFGTASEPTPRAEAERAKRLAGGSGATKERPLNDLSVKERAQLCTWITHEIQPTIWRSPQPQRKSGGYGYRCDDGAEWLGETDTDACSKHVLRCHAGCRSSVAGICSGRWVNFA
jgi:hypothetical protein